tara:strand:- start:28 stop:2439 length:2412 start_codon:yes stop_codon:yes gene_type:complete
MSGIFGAGQLQFLGGEDAFYGFEIGNSLRFNDDDSAYLNRTPASAGNRRTHTLSMWFKRSTLGTTQFLFGADASDVRTDLYFGSNDILQLAEYQGMDFQTTQVFRDPSAWYHLVISIDTTQATDTNRVKIYINGDQITSFGSATYPTQDFELGWSKDGLHRLGARAFNTSSTFDGYLAEVNFIDGTALDPTSFGETKENIWIPKDTSGLTFGTNGFRLQFKNSSVGSASSSTVGADTSGNNHHFSSNNIATTDNMTDSPTDNFCTFNPLLTNDNSTFSDGNLQVTSASGASTTGTTFGMSSGKWYAEFICTAKTSVNMYVGIVRADRFDGDNQGNEGNNIGYIYVNDISGSGRIYYPTGDEAYGAAWAVNDVIGVAFDADTRNVTFYKNGVSQGVYTRIASEYSGGTWMMVVGEGQSSATATFVAEFGQGGFTYTPPTDYLALSTANLPDPVIDPAQGSSPEDYFGTVLYTGNSSTQSITGVGFQPDFTWIKLRNQVSGFNWNHVLQDVVRGAGNTKLFSNQTDQEGLSGDTGHLSSFDSDGFSLTKTGSGSYDYAQTNASGGSYVAWNWKANGSGVSNTDGSITSTVSANTESGFSIVTFTQTSPPVTIGHALGQIPDVIIVKGRDSTSNWETYHSGLGSNTSKVFLNLTNAANTSSTIWNSTTPTSSVFSWNGDISYNNEDFVAYCFHSVEGFSKCSSYVGNGSSDGVFVYTGFRPSFVMVKATDVSAGWEMWDTTRDTYNVVDHRLNANSSAAESTAYAPVDILSNGFKLRDSINNWNGSGNTYIYMAFAENPFKYSNAR